MIKMNETAQMLYDIIAKHGCKLTTRQLVKKSKLNPRQQLYRDAIKYLVECRAILRHQDNKGAYYYLPPANPFPPSQPFPNQNQLTEDYRYDAP